MCVKGARRCPEIVAIREEAVEEWCSAETFADVRSCWSRLGGRTTMHRYGRPWFSSLAKRRHGQVAEEELAEILASLPEKLEG